MRYKQAKAGIRLAGTLDFVFLISSTNLSIALFGHEVFQRTSLNFPFRFGSVGGLLLPGRLESQYDMEVRGLDLSEIYSENVAAKIFQVAQRGFKQQVCTRDFDY